MKTTELALEYDNKGHAFIGYGYKRLTSDDERARRKRWNWEEARGHRSKVRPPELTKAYVLSNDGKSYIPGFHIFLNYEDALKYNYNSGLVVKVKFKDVLAFGTNTTSSYGKVGPCVVARYEKIVEVFPNTDKRSDIDVC